MLQSEFINDLTKTKSLFNKYTLMDEVNINNIDINKLYNEFIKFRNSIVVMSSKDYAKKYSRLEFEEDNTTLYVYNGCYIEYGTYPSEFYLPLYNTWYEGNLSNCELYLFMHFYMYEYIGIDNLKRKEVV